MRNAADALNGLLGGVEGDSHGQRVTLQQFDLALEFGGESFKVFACHIFRFVIGFLLRPYNTTGLNVVKLSFQDWKSEFENIPGQISREVLGVVKAGKLHFIRATHCATQAFVGHESVSVRLLDTVQA